jgi:outer membrane protein assembly factor BamB
MNRFRLFALLGVFTLTSSIAAEDWPQWRGANFDNVSNGSGFATSWDDSKNVKWKVELPGAAGASPVVFGDRIFLTSLDGEDLVLMCFGTDGKAQWTQKVGSGNRNARRDEGNYASPSPATDGKHVWATFGSGEISCFTVAGEEVWKKDLQEEYGDFDIQFGMSSTPVLFEGKLYLQLIHGRMDSDPSEALVVSLDGQTGNEEWKHVRKTDATSENKHSYASPTIYDDGELKFLLTHGADYLIAHSLKDGSEIWRCGGFHLGRYNPTLRLVSSPVCSNGLIVVPTAKRGPVLGLKPTGSGDITEVDKYYHWKLSRNTPDVPTPVIHDGLVYLCSENGVLTCVDAKTGDQVYQERIESDRYRASPVYADGHVYLTSRSGVITVVKAGRDFKKVSENDMGEEISASPAFSNSTIYLRTFDHLYAIGQ